MVANKVSHVHITISADQGTSQEQLRAVLCQEASMTCLLANQEARAEQLQRMTEMKGGSQKRAVHETTQTPCCKRHPIAWRQTKYKDGYQTRNIAQGDQALQCTSIKSLR